MRVYPFGVPLNAARLALASAAALSAGFVDAVVGGGGLIQLPAVTVLLPSSTPTDVILGTNKLAAAAGTSVAAASYRHRLAGVSRSTIISALMVAMVASFTGARLSSHLSKTAFRPMVMTVLLGVLVLTLRRPDLGTRSGAASPGGRRLHAIAGIVGLYDGLVGPGTGMFFTIGLVLLVGFDFVGATAFAKVLNLGTNVAALAWFVPHRAIAWTVAPTMAVANLVGGFVGARTALRRGVSFVRAFFIVVVTCLLVRLAWDTVR